MEAMKIFCPLLVNKEILIMLSITIAIKTIYISVRDSITQRHVYLPFLFFALAMIIILPVALAPTPTKLIAAPSTISGIPIGAKTSFHCANSNTAPPPTALTVPAVLVAPPITM